VALITCPDCGHSVSDRAPVCVQCGRPLGAVPPTPPHPPQAVSAPAAEAPAPQQADAPVASRAGALPLFPVATRKFIVLSICTFGIYELYWCYQNWKRLKAASGENLSPFWRAFFAPLWGFSLFKRIRAAAVSAGVPVDWSSGALATFYLVLDMTWRLPDPWWLISFGTLIPMISVQQAAQRVNERHVALNTEGRNDNYSTANIATIVIGGLFLILVVIGTFMPE